MSMNFVLWFYDVDSQVKNEGLKVWHDTATRAYLPVQALLDALSCLLSSRKAASLELVQVNGRST